MLRTILLAALPLFAATPYLSGSNSNEGAMLGDDTARVGKLVIDDAPHAVADFHKPQFDLVRTVKGDE